MKKGLILLTLLLALGMSADAASQKHRHHAQPQAVQVDSANSQDAVEAFSDTTGVADAEWDNNVTLTGNDAKTAVKEALNDAFSSVDGEDIAGMIFVLGVLFIVFCGFPLIVLIGIIFLIRKNRKDKVRLAQMAMQNGQPIPDQLLDDKPVATNKNEEYQRGLRQIFVGIGLAIFLGLAAGEWGFGIGALVFCIGLGKVVASKTSENRDHKNDLIQQNYD